MKIKGIIDTCFGDYKKIAMYIAMPYCTFKCDKENNTQLCQNWKLTKEPNINVSNLSIIEQYCSNPMTEAIIFSGLEPFESFQDILHFIWEFRKYSTDDVVIYTGFTEDEIALEIKQLQEYNDIYIKFGRYRPNEKSHLDTILGVELASPNQYAKKIS